MSYKVDKSTLGERYGFVNVFSTIKGKTIELSQRLANDKKYMDKHGLILITSPPELSLKQNTDGIE